MASNFSARMGEGGYSVQKTLGVRQIWVVEQTPGILMPFFLFYDRPDFMHNFVFFPNLCQTWLTSRKFEKVLSVKI